MQKSPDSYTKKDWLSANTHGNITHNTTIYRIFRTDHLISDLKNSINTLVNPCYETQGDRLENPLKNAKFDFEGREYELFKGLMTEYYTQSWSLSDDSWGSFGEGYDTIRVKCKAGALLDRLMDEDDPFYSLYYHIGLISYEEAEVIQTEIKKTDFNKLLDSRGYGLLKTVLRIKSDFRKEQEVRLVYIRSPRDGYSHPQVNRVFGGQNQFCAHKFNWDGLIEAYEFNPQNKETHPPLGDLMGTGPAKQALLT